jgi:hypothetical protein
MYVCMYVCTTCCNIHKSLIPYKQRILWCSKQTVYISVNKIKWVVLCHGHRVYRVFTVTVEITFRTVTVTSCRPDQSTAATELTGYHWLSQDAASSIQSTSLRYVQLFSKHYCFQCSVVGIATGYGLDGPRIKSRWGAEIFRTRPDRPWGPPSLLYNGHRVFLGGKERPGHDADPSPPSRVVVRKE